MAVDRLQHYQWDRKGLERELRENPMLDMVIVVNGQELRGAAALFYIEALPERMQYVPIGCPDPLADGSCPGHTIN